MSWYLTDQAIERLRPLVSDPDVVWLRKLIAYFDKNSLWLSRIEQPSEGSRSDQLLLTFANEAERTTLTLGQLREFWQNLQSGNRWDAGDGQVMGR